jgi:hypothetical protein
VWLVDCFAVARVIEAVARPFDTVAMRMRDVDQQGLASIDRCHDGSIEAHILSLVATVRMWQEDALCRSRWHLFLQFANRNRLWRPATVIHKDRDPIERGRHVGQTHARLNRAVFGSGALYLVRTCQVQGEICFYPSANPGYSDLDVPGLHLLNGVAPSALGIECERATAGDRSQFTSFEKDLELFTFNRPFIAGHDMEHWRLAATDTSQDQEEGESENTQPRDARYGAALFHASILTDNARFYMEWTAQGRYERARKPPQAICPGRASLKEKEFLG